MTVSVAGDVSYVLPSEEIRINLENAGSVITTGVSASNYMASYNGIIRSWEVVGIPAGSIVVDVLKANLAIPTVGDRISASDPPTLSSQNLNKNLTITGWSDVQVRVGDVFGINIVSVSSLTNVVITLKVSKYS